MYHPTSANPYSKHNNSLVTNPTLNNPDKTQSLQMIGKQEFFTLKERVNEIQENCKCQSNNNNNETEIQRDTSQLKNTQDALQRDLVNLKSWVKQEDSNILVILRELDTKIELANMKYKTTKGNINREYNNETSGSENNYSQPDISKTSASTLLKNYDALRKNVEAIGTKQNSIFERVFVLEKALNNTNNENKFMKRLNRVDQFLLDLTNSVNDIAMKTTAKENPMKGNDNSLELISLRNSLTNIVGTLKDLDKSLRNEKQDVEQMKNQITVIENHIKNIKPQEQPTDIQNELQNIKSDLNYLSSAIKKRDENKRQTLNFKLNNELRDEQEKERGVYTNQLTAPYQDLSNNVTVLTEHVLSLIKRIDKIEKDQTNLRNELALGNKSTQPRSIDILPARKSEDERNRYQHEVNGRYKDNATPKDNDTLYLKLMDEKTNQHPIMPIPTDIEDNDNIKVSSFLILLCSEVIRKIFEVNSFIFIAENIKYLNYNYYPTRV